LTAVVPLTPRVTVHVVVPKPPVTFISSSSMRIRNVLVGKPLADATVTLVWLALIAPVIVDCAPGPTRQMYELDGVRSTTLLRLLSRLG
jgi:hypothetical protein